VLGGASSSVPPLSFTPPKDMHFGDLKPNPLSESLSALVDSVDLAFEIKLRALRPIYVSSDVQKTQGFIGDFLWTSDKSWNETYPFNFTFRMRQNPFSGQPTRAREEIGPPQLDMGQNRRKSADKRDEERPGPFSVGAAIDAPVPLSWFVSDKDITKSFASMGTRSRLVAIGHGGIFTGTQLKPATEQLLLVTCNWLLGRQDRMPHAANPQAVYAIDRPWNYPRVKMTAAAKNLWHWGTFIGMPAVCVYLGLIVLMLRRVR
jgi:hypothetical protein